MPSFLFLAFLSQCLLAAAQLTSSSLKTHVDTLELGSSFNPVKPSYWTNLPHHRRTPFAVSPDGKSAYLAYLDSSETDVHVIKVDPTTFKSTGTPVTVTGGKEAGGIVAQDDGFALLTNIAVTGTNAPPANTPVPVIVRYTNGKESWRTFVAGPGVHESDGLSMAPDMNGDLVWSEKAQMYGAYFVVTAYTGFAEGHFGDSIQYVNDKGVLQKIPESSAWGCSHNTGIAFEAADAAPFASICAEDHGSIWLNTATRGMSGKKIAGENVTNGASGEPMGGMSGSYSSLARFGEGASYIFAWATRGCVDLTADAWLGGGNTQCSPRTMNHNVGISILSDKQTLAGKEAISTVGAKDGDAQLNLLTTGTADHSNVHAAAFDASSALITWEEIATPTCKDIAMGCSGAFSGSKFQLVDNKGAKVGDAITSKDVYVAGDIVNIGSDLCFPYVSMVWDLSKAVYGGAGTTTKKISFACVGSGSGTGATTPASSATAAPSAASSKAAVGLSSKLYSPVASATGVSSAGVIRLPSSTAVASTPAASATTLQTQVRPSSTAPLASSAASVPASEPSVPVSEPSVPAIPVEEGDDECYEG